MTKRFSFYLANLTILSLPLYVVRWQILGFPTTLLEILILVTVAVWATEKIYYRRFWRTSLEAVPKVVLRLAIGFLVVSFISAMVSPDVRAGLGLWRAYFLEPVLFAWVIFDLAAAAGQFRFLIFSMVTSGIWVALIGIGQLYFKVFTDITIDAVREVGFGRAVAVYNNGNALALYLGPVFALSLALSIKRKILLIASLILLLGLIASGSHGTWLGVGLAVGAVTLGIIWPKVSADMRNLIWRGLPILSGLGLAGLLILLLNISSITPPGQSVDKRIYDDTKILRLCIWEGTMGILRQNPILGAGLGGFNSGYEKTHTCDAEPILYPHQIFLNFWVEVGLAGLAIFLAILWQVGQGLRKAKDQILAFGIAAGFLYLIGHGLVDVPYFKNDLSAEFWVLVALAVAAKESKLSFE